MPRTKQPGSPAHKASKRDPLDEQQIQAFKDHTLTLAQRRNEQDSIIAAVRDIDYAKWKLAMAFQAPPHKGKTRTELASGQFRYLPLGFGQFDRLQLWFLLKCRDLGIPPDQWPPFDIKAPWNIFCPHPTQESSLAARISWNSWLARISSRPRYGAASACGSQCRAMADAYSETWTP